MKKRANKARRVIASAYDAYWFLKEHPALRIRERIAVSPSKAKKLAARGFIITTDRGGKCWREFRHMHRHAMDHNLDIFYVKVDKKNVVNDKKSKNVHDRVWLETGAPEYGYHWDGQAVSELLWTHDYRLDCGGRTFDEALVELANLVLKFHGDYVNDNDEHKTCGGVDSCADCKEHARWEKRFMGRRAIVVPA
jgi:hypothetical protein